MMAENVTSVDLSSVWNHPIVLQARVLFYLVTPKETSFPKEDEVPKYVDKAIPYFLGLIILEAVLLVAQGKWDRLPRANDAYSSMSAGIFSLLPLVLVRNIEVSAYIWVYERYCLFELPWDWNITWFLSMLGTDFMFYWMHRMTHEVNFLWTAHQVHHSSEDYNLSTALRQPLIQRYASWLFYIPMAFFIPPSIFMVHIQFSLLYQYWIHTESVRTLGPLEWILNTPSHHRVHHGRNRKYIDKNYSAVFIIWDRIFGTFQAEEEEVFYGLTHPVASWDIIYIQFFYWKYLLGMAWRRKGFTNKLYTFIKGPGWAPGKPRTGLITDIPDVRGPQPKFDLKIGWFLDMYVWSHFALASIAYGLTQENKHELNFMSTLFMVLFVLWTITNLGFIYDDRWYAPLLEFVRCAVYLGVDSYMCSGDANCHVGLNVIRGIYFVSMAIWGMKCGQMFKEKPTSKVD